MVGTTWFASMRRSLRTESIFHQSRPLEISLTANGRNLPVNCGFCPVDMPGMYAGRVCIGLMYEKWARRGLPPRRSRFSNSHNGSIADRVRLPSIRTVRAVFPHTDLHSVKLTVRPF